MALSLKYLALTIAGIQVCLGCSATDCGSYAGTAAAVLSLLRGDMQVEVLHSQWRTALCCIAGRREA